MIYTVTFNPSLDYIIRVEKPVLRDAKSLHGLKSSVSPPTLSRSRKVFPESMSK